MKKLHLKGKRAASQRQSHRANVERELRDQPLKQKRKTRTRTKLPRLNQDSNDG